MNAEIFAAPDRLLSAALNGSCQGILLALLAGLGLRLLGRSNAATRHAVWFATLLLLALLIPAHYWCHSAPSSAPAPGPTSLAPLQAAHPRNRAHERQEFEVREPAPALLRAETSQSAPDQSGDALQMPRPAGAPGRANPRHRGNLTWSNDTRGDAAGFQAGAAASAFRTEGTAGRTAEKSDFGWELCVMPRIPRNASLVLLAVWLAVAGIKLILLIGGLYQLQKLKDTSSPASPGLEDLFQRLRSKLAVNRTVKLKVSQSHRSALVLGFVHPVIVLPAESAQASALAQAEHILRHELAHVCRRDDWTNLAQRLIEAVLFFHPAVWWISKQLSLEREIACDDSVLHQGVRPQPYALLLANLAGRMTGRLPTVAPGSSSSKSQLQQRINMILNTNRNTSPRLSKARLGFITSAAALVAVLAIYSGPRLVLAQTQPPAPAATPPAAPGAPVPAPRAEVAPVPAIPAPANGWTVAEAGPPSTTPPPEDVEPGPKYKTGEVPAPPAAPAPAALPTLPQAPRPPGAGAVTVNQPPAAVVWAPASGASVALSPPPPPNSASIEERLARLERMVQKLMAQQGLRRPRIKESSDLAPEAELAPEAGYPPPGPKIKELKDLKDQLLLKGQSLKDQLLDPNERELLEERVKREVARATDQALREVARATEQAKRATEQAQRAYQQAAGKYLRADKDVFAQDYDQAQESLNKQLEALQRQREAFEREVQKVERQIERLQEHREQIA